jgi:antitoxin component of MazEF toxin-antitoxin module
MIRAIVAKTGNSYALRVPKSYIVDNHLKLGDVVEIEEPLAKQRAALAAFVAQVHTNGAITSIPDPMEWQREQRQWGDPFPFDSLI